MAKILIACEFSGALRDRFRDAGHSCWSADLLPGEGKYIDCHWQTDVRKFLNSAHWDLIIAHPPCTYLSSSGLHWNKNDKQRQLLTEEAAEFFMEIANDPCPRIAIENPVGFMSTYFRKPDQYIQPYEFGDDASKKTGLWLKGLPKLVPDPRLRVPGRIVGVDSRGRPIERWSNQTDSGQNRLGPDPERAKARSVTYPGIAKAIVEQWSILL